MYLLVYAIMRLPYMSAIVVGLFVIVFCATSINHLLFESARRACGRVFSCVVVLFVFAPIKADGARLVFLFGSSFLASDA